MSRSVVATKSVRPPKALEKFFDDPPLVGNEKREDYEAFFLEIAAVVNPTDVILWILTREYADISWELQRERRIKTEIIKLKQREAQRSLGLGMTAADFERRKLGVESQSLFKKRDPKPEVMEDKSRYLPEGFSLGHRDIDIIDTRIASYLFRRHAVLQQIERYSENLARKLDKAAPVIDGEFTDAEE